MRSIYVIVVSLLVLAYQVHQLREARKPRLERKVLDQLLEGEPIRVKHNTPRSLTPDGKECCGAEKDDLLSLILVLRRLDKQFLQPSRSTNPPTGIERYEHSRRTMPLSGSSRRSVRE